MESSKHPRTQNSRFSQNLQELLKLIKKDARLLYTFPSFIRKKLNPFGEKQNKNKRRLLNDASM